MRVDNPSLGVALTVLGSGCIVVNDAAMKWVVTDHPIGEAIFIRGLFALIPISFLVHRAGGLRALRWHSARSHLLCATLLVFPLFMFIYSLSQLSLSITTLIFFTNPLFVTMLAPRILGERVGWRRRLAVVLGFIGAAIVIGPSSNEFHWVLLLPVVVAFITALRDLLIRRLVQYETSVSLLMSSSGLVTIAALASAPFGWTALTLQDVAVLAVSGFSFGFGIFFMTDALRYGEAGLLSLYKYSTIIWALLLGYLVWGDVPDARVWLGATLIIGAGLFILYRERTLSVR